MSLVRILQASLLIPFLRRSCVIFDLEGHSFAINFVLSINKVTVPDQYIFERTVKKRGTRKICAAAKANWNFEGVKIWNRFRIARFLIILPLYIPCERELQSLY